jgi:hypothetical protein
LTYVDKRYNDCLDGNKTRYEVYPTAKSRLCEDAIVEGEDASFHEEQRPWIHHLVGIPGTPVISHCRLGMYAEDTYQCLNVGISILV